jgi:hypothetical protein
MISEFRTREAILQACKVPDPLAPQVEEHPRDMVVDKELDLKESDLKASSAQVRDMAKVLELSRDIVKEEEEDLVVERMQWRDLSTACRKSLPMQCQRRWYP